MTGRIDMGARMIVMNLDIFEELSARPSVVVHHELAEALPFRRRRWLIFASHNR